VMLKVSLFIITVKGIETHWNTKFICYRDYLQFAFFFISCNMEN
jgi:hypothetical protein